MPEKNLASAKLFGSHNNGALFLAALLLVIWGFIGYDLNRSQEQAIHLARTQLLNLTKIYVEEVNSSIQAINYVLIDLREEWKGNPITFDALVLSRQAHLDPSVAFNVGIINKEGTLIYTSTDWNASPIDVSDREHFKFHYFNRGDGLHISEPLLLRQANRLAIQFSRPLPAQRDEFNGVIVVSVSPEYFSRFHQSIDLGQDSSITLARVHGDLLARYPEPELVLDKKITDAPWVGAGPNEHGIFRKHSEVDEVERLYAWRIMERGDLAVIMGQSLNTILTSYHQLRRTYLAWGSAATFLVLLAAYILGRHQSQRAKADAEMQRMEDALQRAQKLEAIGKLTGGVAHDFNNLLQILSSNVQLLAVTAKRHIEIEPYLKSMSSAIDRGSVLASQLLTFARRQPLHPTVVDLGKLIENVDILIQRLVGQDIKVQTRIAEDLWKVHIDPALFENVIFNLAANARDAMNNRGILNIELRNELIDEQRAADYPGITPGKYVMLAMTDTGAGMPPEVIEKVFEPFFTTKPEGKGTGLGLSTAYGFVKESGGHIHIDSEPGTGTTILVFLPCTTQIQALTHPADITAHTTGGTEAILVVDDNAQLRQMTRLMLEQLGYRIFEASHPQQALDILQSNDTIDILFTDVLMPGGINGVELARQAKALHPGLGILLTSGSYDLHDSVKELHAQIGNVDFLPKPYKFEQVDAAIRNLVSQKTTGL